jgi:hypothetical protein
MRLFLQAEPNVEDGAKIFLQNKLSRSRGKLLELRPLLEAKGKCTSCETASKLIEPQTHLSPVLRKRSGTGHVICKCGKWKSLVGECRRH